MTGRGAGVEVLDAAAEFDQFAVLPFGGLKGPLGVVDIATPCAALLKPFEDRLRRVELSLCGFDDINQIVGDNVLERVRTEFVVMQEAGECSRERPTGQAARAGELPEDRPTAVHVDVKIEEILRKPVFDGLCEDFRRLGPLGFNRLRTEPIGELGLHESGQPRSLTKRLEWDDTVGVSLYDEFDCVGK